MSIRNDHLPVLQQAACNQLLGASALLNFVIVLSLSVAPAAQLLHSRAQEVESNMFSRVYTE